MCGIAALQMHDCIGMTYVAPYNVKVNRLVAKFRRALVTNCYSNIVARRRANVASNVRTMLLCCARMPAVRNSY